MRNFSTKYALIIFFLNFFSSFGVLLLNRKEEFHIPVWIEISSIFFSFLLLSSFDLKPKEYCNECCDCNLGDEYCRNVGYCNGEFINLWKCFVAKYLNDIQKGESSESLEDFCFTFILNYLIHLFLYILSMLLSFIYYIINLMIIQIGKIGTRCISVILLSLNKIAICILIISFKRVNFKISLCLIMGLSSILIILNIFGLIIFIYYNKIEHNFKNKEGDLSKDEPSSADKLDDYDNQENIPLLQHQLLPKVKDVTIPINDNATPLGE